MKKPPHAEILVYNSDFNNEWKSVEDTVGSDGLTHNVIVWIVSDTESILHLKTLVIVEVLVEPVDVAFVP